MPHLFENNDLHATPIEVPPGDCYCYQFHIPKHHPTGLYWYHSNVHGSTTVQLASGMMGLVYVVEAETGRSSLESELDSYGGAVTTGELVIWDPSWAENRTERIWLIDNFFTGTSSARSRQHPLLINGDLNPTFSIQPNEMLHLRALCATFGNVISFQIFPRGSQRQMDAALPFWVVATDGVTHSQPRRHTLLVMVGGQRYELLLRLDQPGTYEIVHQPPRNGELSFLDVYGDPHEEVLAKIVVASNKGYDIDHPNTAIQDMRFTPGRTAEESIDAHDIAASSFMNEYVFFSKKEDRSRAPFPQYWVNDHSFDPSRVDFGARSGQVREYQLFSYVDNVLSFSIHALKFQVKELGTTAPTKNNPYMNALLDFEDKDWRDTIVLPPKGHARIWVRFAGHTTGKTTLYCNFLAHQDTGMMATLYIGGDQGETDDEWIDKGFIKKDKTDHKDWLRGFSIGVFVSSFVLLAYFAVRKRRFGSFSTTNNSTNDELELASLREIT